MDELKPNSNRYKEGRNEEKLPEKKVEKVVKGAVRTKPKNGIVKLADVFIAGDMRMVTDHVFKEILTPMVKKFFYEAITAGAGMFIYGESTKPKSESKASKISYRSYYDKPEDRRETPAARSVYDYDDAVFDVKSDAVEVLLRMDEIVERYPFISVADFKELTGIKTTPTDYNYGWTKNSVKTAEVVYRPREGGYVIKMPRALPLD